MALTKVSRSLLNTGVADASDATAISIDSSENVTLAGHLDLADSQIVRLGSSQDLRLYHDGSNSHIFDAGTGELRISGSSVALMDSTQGEYLAKGTTGGAFTLYYDNSSMLATTTSGIQLEEHLYLKDSKRIYLGTGTDLQIWHDGSNSYIADNGTGDLYLSAADNFYVRKAGTSEVIIKGTADGAAELYYDDSKKLETVTGGVTVTGALTANGGVVVDNTTIDGNSWTTTGGGMTIDVVSDITLDADGGNIYFKHAGTTIGSFTDSSSDFVLTSGVQDKDIIFKGDDGGSAITALTLDMSNAGSATFNKDILIGDGNPIRFGDDQDGRIFYTDGTGLIIENTTSDTNIIFKGNDGGSTITALTLDMSEAGAATFNGAVTIGGDLTVSGTTTTLNTATLDVEDKNITLNKGSGDTSGSADGAGITIQDAVDASNDASLTWDASNDRFDFSHDLKITSTNRDMLHLRRNASSGDAGINFENTSGNLSQIYAMSTGNFVIDAVADITLDADGGNVYIKDAGTTIGQFFNSANDFVIKSEVNDQDLVFKGVDNSANITALTLDMSDAGTATFNHDIILGDDSELVLGADSDLKFYHSGSVNYIKTNSDLPLKFYDAGGASMIDLTPNGAVSLYHNGSAKLATASGGVSVTGEVAATSLDISGDVDIDGTLETDNLTVGGSQGSDGQVLTSTGSGVGWESVSAGTTTLDGLSEAKHGGGSGDFAGSILISHDGTTGTLDNALYNTGYGYEVFDKITSGDSNTAIGFQAAYDLTSSSNNTLVGRLAGANVSTGGNHTLIGYSAGDAISDSVHNTAVGYEAQGASNGNYNTAIGDRALHATNGGDDNTAIGSRAHYGTANSATRNTVVGVSAMEGATTGSYNCGFGVRALYLNTSGTENVAAGYLCMDANTTGSYNVAYGTNALGGNETGANNVAIGHESLMAYTGGDNVAIGYRAGKAADQSRNTYIGYDAGTAQNGSADNMAIGYMALSRQTTGANGNIAIGNYTGRAVVSSASTSQLVAIGHSVASNASAALAGYQNCFIGYNIASASGLAGAFRNTALGANALTDLTTGDNNTTLGNMAGNSITTATNNLCLGYQAGESGSPSGTLTTSSNTIVLGDDNIGALYCTQSSINTSDRRDKADITNFTGGLDFIKKMQPVTYKWDRRSWYLPRDEEGNITDEDITKVTPDGSKKENVTHVGFIAQDVETLEKEIGFASDNTNRLLTNLTEDGNRYGMKYERLVTVLVNAVKELSTKLDAAETRIKTLEDA